MTDLEESAYWRAQASFQLDKAIKNINLASKMLEIARRLNKEEVIADAS